MALEIHDRVKETTTTTGTGTYTLAGAVTGFETFTANLDNGDTTYYCCTDNTDFEIGIGTFTSSGTTLARTTILASSNSNSAVNWSSGTRTIFMTYPADKAVFEDADGHVSIPHDLFVAGGLIDLKNDGGAVSQIKFYCESSNAHAQTLIGAPHSASAANTLRLPDHGAGVTTTSDLVSTTITQTLTNKSLTAPILTGSSSAAGSILFKEDTDNGTNAVTLIGPASTADVTVTLPAATDTLIGKATTDTLTNKSIDSDNNTITNIVNADIKSSAAIADTKLDTISTAGKVAISALDIDGGTDIGAALADADEIIVDDGGGGTNRKSDMSRVKTYIADVTLTTAAQTNITSLGTLTALTVDNVAINGTTIGHTDDTDLMTVADGVLTVAGEVSMTTLDIGGTNVTATATELNIMDGVTSTTAELNILDGVTATASELNIMDGVTSTTAELNILDGVTATASELNIMDGVTATTAELNHSDGVTSNIQTQMDTKASKGFATAMAIAL